LASRGFAHQVASEPPAGARANRVLVASRVPIESYQLDVPAIDIHLPANVVAVRVSHLDLTIVAVRVPWYAGKDAPNLMRTWEWLSAVAADNNDRPTVLMGDLNVSMASPAARGASHFRSILENGWKRAPSGPTYLGNGGKGSEIDHILATEQCVLTNSTVVSMVGQYELAGTSGAISDHAALMCDVSVPRRTTHVNA
jgi:endonuclease/exonuclease/phosphatase family metal-dependent hydrolase